VPAYSLPYSLFDQAAEYDKFFSQPGQASQSRKEVLAMKCSVCGSEIVSDGLGVGYGRNKAGEALCYPCCGVAERKNMLETGKGVLYLVSAQQPSSPSGLVVQNWPGSFSLPVHRTSVGRHNIAGVRRDVWFSLGGQNWHGVVYGAYSQVVHCQATSGRKAGKRVRQKVQQSKGKKEDEV
jgi:hypothetical protein